MAFACPHHAIFAAAYDGLDADFVYAVAGSATDAQCGECYQVQLLDAERVWSHTFPQLVGTASWTFLRETDPFWRRVDRCDVQGAILGKSNG